jgi:diadenosine tetraphosphatase ApaH/serine/threonine PP2A family protein phosphatase
VRYAIISDIHANLEAFEAVRAEIGRLAVGRVINLGDIVGYGASPAECIRGVRQIANVAIAGNHDFGVAGLSDIRYFNTHARRAVVWTAGVLGQQELDYLHDLPLVHVENGLFRVVHATPSDPAKWEYLFGTDQAAGEFKAFPEPLCFVGHSHQPGIFEIDQDGVVTRLADRVRVREGRRQIVNVGSVGQPRDGDPRACLCIYDAKAGEIEIVRVAYDVEGAKRKILEAHLPPVLANRLSHGE